MNKLALWRAADGFACGVILCAWFVGASSEDVWILRLPCTVWLTFSIACDVIRFLRRSLTGEET